MALYLRILSDETDPDEMEVPPPSSLSSFEYQHNRRFANVLLIGAALFVASLLLSIIYYAVLRRRRRRLHSLAAADLSVGGNQDDGSSSEEGDPLHHVWYIRTVGLEESTISSISVTEYRAGEGHLESASTCSVCLGEFYDGDRIRVLPKCAHAFHVPCIDTWLRAHVNCPLCRALIVDPQGEPALAGPDPSTSTTRDSTNSVSVSSSGAGRHIGNPLLHEQQNGGSQTSVDVVVITVNPFGAFDSLPESSSSQEKIDTGANSLHPVTRSVSMDTPLMNSVVVRIESGQTIFDKDGKDPNFTGASAGNGTSSKELKLANHKDRSDMERSVSTNGRGFFFSRHGRVARMHSMPM